MFAAEFEKRSAIAMKLRPDATHATLIHHTKDGKVIKPLTPKQEKEWKDYRLAKPGSKKHIEWEEKYLKPAGMEKAAEDEGYLSSATGATGHAMGGMMGASLVSLPVGYALTKRPKNHSEKAIESFSDKMIEHNKLKLKKTPPMHPLLAAYVPKEGAPPHLRSQLPEHGAVLISKSHPEAVVAHEIGHAKDFSKVHKKLRGAYAHSRRAGMLAGLVAGVGLASSKDEDKQKYAPAALVAGHLPTLWQEGAATYHGTKEIARQRGSAKAAKSLIRTLPAFGTYLALPAAGAYGLKKFIEKRKQKSKGEEDVYD